MHSPRWLCVFLNTGLPAVVLAAEFLCQIEQTERDIIDGLAVDAVDSLQCHSVRVLRFGIVALMLISDFEALG